MTFFSSLIKMFILIGIPTNLLASGTIMEWILLKYEVPLLAPHPVASSSSGHLQFRICACPFAMSPTKPNPSNCKCESTTVFGKSSLKGLFPSSCLTKPEMVNGKCLMVKIQLKSADEASFIYARVDLANLILTKPEYQQLRMEGGRKSISGLSTQEPGKSINLAYSIQMPDESSSKKVEAIPSPSKNWPITAKSPWNARKLEKSKPDFLINRKIAAAQTQAVALSSCELPNGQMPAPVLPELCQLIAQMGTNDLQIRQYLMADAGRQRIHPHQFDVERYKRAVIQIHNRYRQMHGTEELAHDRECEQSAKSWAESVSRKANCLGHEPQKRFGESLFYYSSLEPHLSDPETLAEATVRTFYVEGRDYRRFGSTRWDPVRHGHFTQMLWRQTRRIGVGVSILTMPAGAGDCLPSSGGRRQREAWLFYVVLRYEPPGNIHWGADSFDGNVTMEAGSSSGNEGDHCLHF